MEEIVDYCAEIGLFDPVVWRTKCILTSRAIQSRYIDICKLAKKKIYIPLEILLVESEQPLREPVAMSLFETETAKAAETIADTSTTDKDFQKLPETFQNIPETSGNIPEEIDKEKKSKEKENKEKSSSIPLPASRELTEEEAIALLSSTPLGRSSTPLGRNKPEAASGNTTPPAIEQTGQRLARAEAEAQKARNPKGLIEALRTYNLSPRELEEVLKLSGHGEIGNPVWQILGEMHGNKRLRMPRLFLLKRLRDAVGLIVAENGHGDDGVKNKSAS